MSSSIQDAARAAPNYRTLEIEEETPTEQPRRCTKKRCGIITAIATAILLLGGFTAYITLDRCKTIQCAPAVDSRDCLCITDAQYRSYKEGNYTCNPCSNAPYDPHLPS